MRSVWRSATVNPFEYQDRPRPIWGWRRQVFDLRVFHEYTFSFGYKPPYWLYVAFLKPLIASLIIGSPLFLLLAINAHDKAGTIREFAEDVAGMWGFLLFAGWGCHFGLMMLLSGIRWILEILRPLVRWTLRSMGRQ